MLFRSNGSQLDLVFSAVERVPGSWQFQPGDRFFIGDFNNDGKDEVVVYNSTNWVMEYLGLLVDDGNNGLKLIARYDDAMPGWQFHLNDQYYVADFDGDGKKDFVRVQRQQLGDSVRRHAALVGRRLYVVQRYDANMPGWQMRPATVTWSATFPVKDARTCGLQRRELVHSISRMLRSNGTSLSMARRYDNSCPVADARERSPLSRRFRRRR